MSRTSRLSVRKGGVIEPVTLRRDGSSRADRTGHQPRGPSCTFGLDPEGTIPTTCVNRDTTL
jgi:hypothetical protein